MRSYGIQTYFKKECVLGDISIGTVLTPISYDVVIDDIDSKFYRLRYNARQLYRIISGIEDSRRLEHVLYDNDIGFLNTYKFSIMNFDSVCVKQEGENIVVYINNNMVDKFDMSVLSKENTPVYRLVKYINDVYQVDNCSSIKVLISPYTYIAHIVLEFEN